MPTVPDAAANVIAERVIACARESGEPVVFVTGNAYMPPLRSFSEAEDVWQHGDERDWETLVDTLERLLSEANVLLACPEYDNALYVVDLARWEYDDDAAGDSLQDEWRAVQS